MQLVTLLGHDQCDWEWTGQFERSTCDLEGRSVQLLDPTVIHFTRPGHDQIPTYGFQSAELIAIAAIIYGNIYSKLTRSLACHGVRCFHIRCPMVGVSAIFSTLLYIN